MKIKYLITLWLAIAILGSYVLGYTPLLLPVVYLIFSVLTYVMYAKDKAAAKSKAWRTSEKTLHLLSLCGGWLGAVLAQETLRHKTQKTPFQVVFWLTVIINIAAFTSIHLTPLNGKLNLTMEQLRGAMSVRDNSNSLLLGVSALFRYAS